MKTYVSAVVLCLSTVTAFAQGYGPGNSSISSLDCKSANYQVTVSDMRAANYANYAINNVLNDGADVTVEQKYVTSRALAISLEVDGQSEKFEVFASAAGAGLYKGKLSTGKTVQDVICKVQK